MRYFVELAYLGSDFHGSQTQPNGITVQEVLEQAFATILRTPVPLTFAGRTDAGVHAEHMFAHFDFDAKIPANLVARLNNLLPPAVAVYAIRPVRPDAHARFSALSRTYEYRILTAKDPFRYGRAARVAEGLDFEKMNLAAAKMLGRQDFASFCRVHTDVKTTFCTVTRAEWRDLVFTITADRFLRNMVRAVVGTLLDVGRGKMTVEDFENIIAQRNRCKAGQSALAEGLYLIDIQYDKNIYND